MYSINIPIYVCHKSVYTKIQFCYTFLYENCKILKSTKSELTNRWDHSLSQTLLIIIRCKFLDSLYRIKWSMRNKLCHLL